MVDPRLITYKDVATPVNAPSGFNWNFSTHPVNIYKESGRRFTTDIDLRTKISSDIWNGPTYFVSPSGNNSNNGTSITTTVRSLWKARQLLEASSSPGGIIIAISDPSGITSWDRFNDLNDTGGAGGAVNAKPTKPFALMGVGGLHLMGPFQHSLVWTFDSTTRTYYTSRTAVASLIDVSLSQSLGFMTRMVKLAANNSGANQTERRAANQALVSAKPGSYILTSDNDLIVRMDRDVIPSDTTLKVILTAADALNIGAIDAYISGFALMGSHLLGAVAAYDKATHNLILEDCMIAFSGSDGAISRNALQVDYITGFVGLNRVKGISSFNDIFNFHANEGNLHALLINCEGNDAGRDGASPVTQSNQIVTLHEDVKVISINTKGNLASGGCVRNINTSQHWDLGSEYSNDRGDLRFSGSIPSVGVLINDTSKYWGDCITVRGCSQTFNASASAEIRLREPIEIGGRRSGSGLITTY